MIVKSLSRSQKESGFLLSRKWNRRNIVRNGAQPQANTVA